VHEQTAVFLVFYSERRLAGSHRYPLSRAAWRTLAAAAARGDSVAIEAVWQAWLRNPDGERWDLLSQCRGERELTGAVLAAAIDPARSARSRAAIGAFCASHDLAPPTEPERAVFYLLTGQPAQLRAADPAGEALSTAYQAADEPAQAAMRQAMADSGDLDLVGVVAARHGPARPVTDAERRYLAAELARRRDWPALWDLALRLPLAETIEAVRLIDPGWRPAGDLGRELLARLAQARPDGKRPGKAALTTVRIQIPGRLVGPGAFSPDGRRLAALVYAPGEDSPRRVCEFDLPRGTLLAEYDYQLDRVLAGALLYVGDAIVVASRTMGSKVGGRAFLDRFAGGSPDLLAEFPSAISGLAPYGDGFVVLRQDWALRREVWAGNAEHVRRDLSSDLIFCDSVGRTLRSVRVVTGGLSEDDLREVVVEPGSGRLAIRGYGVELLAPFGEQSIARSWSATNGVCFLGPGHFVAERYGTLQTWRLVGGRLVRQPVPRRALPDHRASAIVSVPRLGQLAVLWGKGNWSRQPRFVRYYDAQTFAEVKGQHGLAGMTGQEVWSSPDGSAHALASDGAIDVALTIHPLASQLARPLGDMTPSDLAAVAGSLGSQDQFPAERPSLELLRACLEYRFGSDFAIGRRPTSPGEPDDIGLLLADAGGRGAEDGEVTVLLPGRGRVVRVVDGQGDGVQPAGAVA
jgi:hypothetical protein